MLVEQSLYIVPDQRGRASLNNVKADLGVETCRYDVLQRVSENPGPGQYTFNGGDYVVGPGLRNQRLRAWVVV